MTGTEPKRFVAVFLLVVALSGCIGVVSEYVTEDRLPTDDDDQKPREIDTVTRSKSKLSAEVRRVLDRPISELENDDRVIVVNGSRIAISVDVTENRTKRLERELAVYGFEISDSISTATGFQAVGTVPKDNITALATHPAVASISLPDPPVGQNDESNSTTPA